MSPRLPWLVLLLCWLGAGVVLLGPLLDLLHSHLLGLEYVDHYGTQWFYWFVDDALSQGRSLAHTDLYFHPWGKDLFGHTGANVLDAILAIPFRRLLGPVLGYNAFVLAGGLATAAATVVLGRRWTQDPVALGIGALWLSLSPFVLLEFAEGRPTQAILVAVVLALHALLEVRERAGWRWPVAAGVLLAIVGYQYWYYAFFCGLSALSLGLWSTVAPVRGTRIETLARFALAAVVAAVLVAPVAAPLLLAQSSGEDVPGLLDVARWTWTTSPPETVEGMRVGLYLWQPLGGGAGFFVQDVDTELERFLVRGRWTTLVLLLSAVLWCVWPGKHGRSGLLALALPAVVVALGPLVSVFGWTLPNPLYIGLAKALPFVRRLWWPGRAFCVLLVLGTAMSMVLLGRLRVRPRVQAAAAMLGTLACLVQLRGLDMAPLPAWDATIPAGYSCLAGGPPGAVVELPYSWTQAHLYYQSAHGRPILGGMLENNPVFTPEQSQALREDNAWVATLLALARTRSEDIERVPAADKEAVFELGYRYVLLQKDPFEPAGERPLHLGDNVRKARLRRMRDRLSLLAGPAVWEDARVALYAPWGDPNPCAELEVARDPRPVGPTEVTADQILRPSSPERQLLRRVGVEPVEVDPDAETQDTGAVRPANMPG